MKVYENNIIQFEEFKQQLKLKRKVKYKKYRHKYYVAIPRIKYRSVQGFHSSKKEFLKETIEIFKQLLDQTVYNELGTGEDIRIVDNVPDVMDDYIDLFYRNLKL